MASRSISVIVPTKDRPQDLVRCLDSVLNQTLQPDEIIIVDASKTDMFNSALITRANEKVRTIYLRTAAGLTHQKNTGVEASSGDIVFFLDDDTILEKDFIKEIVNIFDHNQERKVAGVCGKIITPKKQDVWLLRFILISVIQVVQKIISIVFLLRKKGDGTFRASGFPNYPYITSKVKRVEFLCGGLTGWRREILIEFKFDENLNGYSYYEDVDFSYRVSRKYENIFTPYAKALHNVSLVARIDAATRKKMMIDNSHYLFKKNLPQTLKHKLAFYWSIIGLCLSGTLQAVVTRNMGALKGLIAGLVSITLHSDKFGTSGTR